MNKPVVIFVTYSLWQPFLKKYQLNANLKANSCLNIFFDLDDTDREG